MRNIDSYSYQCGVIDCFNEMVYAGVKSLALSHPMDSATTSSVSLWKRLSQNDLPPSSPPRAKLFRVRAAGVSADTGGEHLNCG